MFQMTLDGENITSQFTVSTELKTSGTTPGLKVSELETSGTTPGLKVSGDEWHDTRAEGE